MTEKAAKIYNEVMKLWLPPEKRTVAEWADENRVLFSESSAEPGHWRSNRTPYMIPIMEAFTDRKVERIYVMSSSQVGKSELLNNCIGYAVDVDPGPMLFIHPTVEMARYYSKGRLDSMFEGTPVLKVKMKSTKSRSGGKEILRKGFAGGHLTFVGANAPAGLSSFPIRYVFGDEWDRWPVSAGDEGDPAKLAEKRTLTFHNRKIVMVSTPTVKDVSAIEDAYLLGTQEEWRYECPNCGEYHYLTFNQMVYEKESFEVNHQTQWKVWDMKWRCPDCCFLFSEQEMKRQHQKYVAQNPEALKEGIRSFRLNAFSSPWLSWESIALEFQNAYKDPEKLKVVFNTLFGESFEDRTGMQDETEVEKRAEEYEAEVPDGVLVLTCAVDTQDDRLEYEVVGHGWHKETWGIKYGVIPGDPDLDFPWERLDEVIDKTYSFKNGRGIRISITFVDSGGNKTQSVYKQTRARLSKRVFSIKGKAGDGVPLVDKASTVYLNADKRKKCWLYLLGVNAGKAEIMRAVQVGTPGPRYMHYPKGRGYDEKYYRGLLSERLIYRGKKFQWEPIPGRPRNEPLDIRNYNLAAFSALDVDLLKVERRLKNVVEKSPTLPPPKRKKKPKSRTGDEW